LIPITMQGLERAGKKPPAQEQSKTMEKTMRRNNGNSRKSGRVINVGCDARRQATALRARRCQGDRVCFQIFG
ncbi:MAG TPA: hypothetical protein VII40_19440, partial [Xanthobacteraceae bacterium]